MKTPKLINTLKLSFKIILEILYLCKERFKWIVIARYRFKNTEINPTNYFQYDDIINNKISIWEYTYIWPRWRFYAKNNNIHIWKYCSIADNVYMITYNHSTKYITHHINQYNKKIEINHEIKKGDISIGNDVRIWHNCTILPWINIWNGAVVWAWAIVTKDVPPYAIVWWNPAKIIKYRFTNSTIQKIEKLKRRDWDLDKIKKNREMFNKKMD